MVTMHQVARAAGVSQTTVSHVLNGTRQVAPATERAVRQAIEETGYVGDDLARSMRSGRTNTIGVAMSAISNIFFAEVVAAVERAAFGHGKLVTLIDTHDEPDTELAAVQALVSRRVDGLILAPSAAPSRSLDLLRRYGTPTVLLDRAVPGEDGAFDTVGVDNHEPTAGLVDLLARAGHTEIGFVADLPGLSTTEERLAGFRAGLERNGLTERDESVVRGRSDAADARAATLALLDRPVPRRPTALVSANNAMTIGVLGAIRERSLSVPADLSLACFDDFPWAEVFTPRLTVVAQPMTELGGRAVTMLHERMADPERPSRHIRLAPELRQRDSIRPLDR